ncbi:MAG: hypothetical protein M3Q69_03220 [Acidobacteriota bacterium]|nr:hypothetical protein [Acidobacteriota bacterium]
MKTIKTIAVVALAALTIAGCSSELTDNAAPVELVVTYSQTISTLDIGPTTDDDCDKPLGTIHLQVIPKGGSTGGELTSVRVTRYSVSYRRTDGGTIVPPPYVRAIDTLVGVGENVGSDFRIFEIGAFSQAPFAALQPQNGGRDPETGRSYVKLEVRLQVYGQTLAGDNVSDVTTIPMEICYLCPGGCS